MDYSSTRRSSMTHASAIRRLWLIIAAAAAVFFSMILGGRAVYASAAAYSQGNTSFYGTSVKIMASAYIDNTAADAGQFTVQLKDENDNVLQEKSNDEKSFIYFDDITYDQAGTYTYYLTEVKGDDSNISYSTLEWEITVKVESVSGKSYFKITPQYRNMKTGTVFTYPYFANTSLSDGSDEDEDTSYNEACLSLNVYKRINTNYYPGDYKFSFTIYDEDGNELQTAQNDYYGNVKFDALTFDQPGTYKYKIKEINDAQEGFTYDENTFDLVVEVEASSANNLKVTSYYYYDEEEQEKTCKAIFDNGYTQYCGASFTPCVYKYVDSKYPGSRTFTFKLYDADGNELQTAQNGTDGKVSFEPIRYTETGTYTYTIKEVNDGQEGIVYDDTVYSVKVVVKQDSYNRLYVYSRTYTNEKTGKVTCSSSICFNNTTEKTYCPTSFTPCVYKWLNNNYPGSYTFTFNMYDENGNEVQTATNSSSGKVNFSAIQFTKPGTYKYTIKEINDGQAGINYDSREYELTVIVKAYSNGQLYIADYYYDELTDDSSQYYCKLCFYNTTEKTYCPASFTPCVYKWLNSYYPGSYTFTFKMYDEDGNEVQTATNNSSGKVDFSALKFTKPGTYKYTIKEINDGQEGITYDDSEYELTVIVKAYSNGQLYIADYYYDDLTDDSSQYYCKLCFNNTKNTSVQINAKKYLNGEKPGDQKFTFVLAEAKRDSLGYFYEGDVLQEKQNDSDGNVTFDKINYTSDDYGYHYYFIYEKNDGQDGITYDGRRYLVQVYVSSDGATVNGPVYYSAYQTYKWCKWRWTTGCSASCSASFYNCGESTPSSTTATLNAKKFLNNEAPGEETFTFYVLAHDADPENFTEDDIVRTATNDADGNVVFDPIEYSIADSYHYYIVEETSNPVTGVTYDETVYEAVVDVVQEGSELKATVTYYDADGNKIDSEVPEFYNTKVVNKKIEIPVTKTWVGDAGTEATVHLYADGTEVASATLNADNNWTYTFTDLDEKNSDGTEIVYTLTEDAIDGYTSEISGDASSGFTVTNTKKIEIPVTKTWIGDAGTEATVHLFADGTEVASATLNADNNWTYTFTDLDQVNSDGTEITYTLTEDAIDGYTSEISGDASSGFTVTNTKKISIPVTKTWIGETGSAATVHLLANGTEVASATLTADNNWAYTFTDLPQADSNGTIDYTLTEDAIDGYTSEISGDASNGFTVTNTEAESVSVRKEWMSEERTDSVTIRLVVNGESTDRTLILSEDNNWEGAFENLPKYDSEGNEITYTVSEDPMDGYVSQIEVDSEGVFVVYNAYIPAGAKSGDFIAED